MERTRYGPPVHPPLRLAACLPIALVLLCGCAGERSPHAAPLPPLTLTSPTAAPSPSAPPSPASQPASPSPTALPVGVPAAATANTPQGAGAFTRFYFDELLKAYATQDTRTVRALAADSCRTCAGVAGGIDGMREKSYRIVGAPIELLTAEAPGFGDEAVTVDVQYQVPAYKVVDAMGKLVYDSPGEKRNIFIITLQRMSSHWLMSKIQVP